MRAALLLALLLDLATPASAHLQVRGIPLSELAARSPIVIVGRVEAIAVAGARFPDEINEAAATSPASSHDATRAQRRIRVRVEHAVIGKLDAETIEVGCDTHHPPDYAVGEQVLFFLQEAEAPFTSRQTEADRVAWPVDAAQQVALIEGVTAWASLREAHTREARLPRLRDRGLELLDSKHGRIRREALIDLITLAPVGDFSPESVAALVDRAKRSESGLGSAPGLVTLLAALPPAVAVPALDTLLSEAQSARVRMLAARALQERRAASSLPLLAAALDDPDLGVRLTAERALESWGTEASRRALDAHGPVSKPTASLPGEPGESRTRSDRTAASR